MVQVFSNLIENACKYGETGDKVDILVDIDAPQNPSEQYAEVTIKDYGEGISEEHLNRITERFYRIDVERSREKQGTGLGLAIVKHILHRHGTKLTVKSSLGEGSEFSARFQVEKLD